MSIQPPSARYVPTSAPSYGLEEEEFANNPFHLFVVCSFLNKTEGKRAIPLARDFIRDYPTPETLAEAYPEDVRAYFKRIGLSRRARWLIKLANQLINDPPMPNEMHYKKPSKCSEGFKSEVAHLCGVGKYASDAWKIFCRDKFYQDHGYEEVAEASWKTVLPDDKELRGYLVWRWEKEGYIWDPDTGKKAKESATTATEIDELTYGVEKIGLEQSRLTYPTVH